jgi:prepilin-type N-terminal cleavage/methylation domain-containing protein
MLQLSRYKGSRGLPWRKPGPAPAKAGVRETSRQSPVSNHQKGFSLLEIVIALAIVTIGIVGVMVIFPAGLRAQQRAADFTTAATLGSQALQYITARGYGALPPRPANPGPFNFPEPNLNWSWRESYIYNPNPLVQVAVSIYWIDEGVNRERRFVTFMAP